MAGTPFCRCKFMADLRTIIAAPEKSAIVIPVLMLRKKPPVEQTASILHAASINTSDRLL